MKPERDRKEESLSSNSFPGETSNHLKTILALCRSVAETSKVKLGSSEDVPVVMLNPGHTSKALSSRSINIHRDQLFTLPNEGGPVLIMPAIEFASFAVIQARRGIRMSTLDTLNDERNIVGDLIEELKQGTSASALVDLKGVDKTLIQDIAALRAINHNGAAVVADTLAELGYADLALVIRQYIPDGKSSRKSH